MSDYITEFKETREFCKPIQILDNIGININLNEQEETMRNWLNNLNRKRLSRYLDKDFRI